LDAVEAALNAPLKCTPEERKHFAEPALKEAENANYASALDTVVSGLNAHPASEGLLFLKAYFGYKVADNMSNELSSFPRVIQSIGAGALMIDGAMTSQLLSKFQEIVNTLSEAEESINELLQVNPKNKEVVEFKGYIDAKRQHLDQESENMKATFSKSPELAGGFCVGCHKSISYETQKVVFQRSSDSRLQAWHLPCYKSNSGN
jgi:hypothetical protein